jgi:hypothetical protein
MFDSFQHFVLSPAYICIQTEHHDMGGVFLLTNRSGSCFLVGYRGLRRDWRARSSMSLRLGGCSGLRDGCDGWLEGNLRAKYYDCEEC